MTLLAFLRRDHGLTQAQLAARAGLHRVTVLDIERRRINPTPAELERLALALHVDPPSALMEEVEVSWPARQHTHNAEAVTR